MPPKPKLEFDPSYGVFPGIPEEYRDLIREEAKKARVVAEEQAAGLTKIIDAESATGFDGAAMGYAVITMLGMMSGNTNPDECAKKIARIYDEAKDDKLGPVEFAGEDDGPVGSIDDED